VSPQTGGNGAPFAVVVERTLMRDPRAAGRVGCRLEVSARVALFIVAQGMFCPMCPMGWIGILWGLISLAILVAVVLLVLRLAKNQGWIGEARRGNRAEEILRERFARGEIDRETYERMLQDLKRGRPA